VAELFEARRPKDFAIISEIDGQIEFGKDYKSKRRIVVKPTDGKASQGISHSESKHVAVNEGGLCPQGRRAARRLDGAGMTFSPSGRRGAR